MDPLERLRDVWVVVEARRAWRPSPDMETSCEPKVPIGRPFFFSFYNKSVPARLMLVCPLGGCGLGLDVTRYGVSHHSQHSAASSYWHIHAATGRVFFSWDGRKDFSKSFLEVYQTGIFLHYFIFLLLGWILDCWQQSWVFGLFFFLLPHLWGKCLLSAGTWVCIHRSGLKLAGELNSPFLRWSGLLLEAFACVFQSLFGLVMIFHWNCDRLFSRSGHSILMSAGFVLQTAWQMEYFQFDGQECRQGVWRVYWKLSVSHHPDKTGPVGSKQVRKQFRPLLKCTSLSPPFLSSPAATLWRVAAVGCRPKWRKAGSAMVESRKWRRGKLWAWRRPSWRSSSSTKPSPDKWPSGRTPVNAWASGKDLTQP